MIQKPYIKVPKSNGLVYDCINSCNQLKQYELDNKEWNDDLILEFIGKNYKQALSAYIAVINQGEATGYYTFVYFFTLTDKYTLFLSANF